MFRIVPEPIEPGLLANDGAGGFVTFEGKVRDRNDGKRVLRLEYEAYADLAEAEGNRILAEARDAFGLLEAHAIHRTGLLEIGETAIWIGVSAPHRAEAFRACAWIIDEVKKRVPIWKKEHYEGGASDWLGAEQTDVAAIEHELFRRQTILNEVGPLGQKKLAAASVLVVGAGGLGCAALPYLAAAGVGAIGICDPDAVDLSNIHRQTLYGYGDLGLSKADLAAARIRRQSPVVEVRSHPVRLDQTNADDLIGSYDIVLDGTDNFAAKMLLNAACVRLRKPLVQASLYQFEGQILVVLPGSEGGCLRCLWPQAPYDGCVGTCGESGVLGVVPGLFGVLQANEVIKLIIGHAPVLSEEVMTLDLLTYCMLKIRRARRHDCPVCGSGTEEDVAIDIDWDRATKLGLEPIDIREPDEWEHAEIAGVVRIPQSQARRLKEYIEGAGRGLLICAQGSRSARAAREFRALGFEVYSLLGGMDQLGRKTPG